MDSRCVELFVARTVAAFDKQLCLASLISDLDWQFDMASGIITFCNHFQWRAQVLATESEISGTWLWAWANDASSIPHYQLQASLTVKQFGEQHRILELSAPQVAMQDIDGHTLALIASGVCRANAYYRCPYDGGAVYLLIMDASYPRNTEEPLSRIATIFPQAIAAMEIPNHRLAFLAYVESYSLRGRTEGNHVIVEGHSSGKLTATFDGQDRLMRLDVQLAAQRPTAEPSSLDDPPPQTGEWVG